MITLKKLGWLAGLLCLPFATMAWGTNGHRICGEIASTYLTPKAKAAIKQILGNESIAMASNWADFIKSDDRFRYLSSWHYVDFDKAYTLPEMEAYLAKDTDADAYTKLNFMIAELKKPNLSKQNKLLYLRMVIHVVEDVHQPMHTAHKDDKGGNDFKLNWFGKPTNLHSIWDSELIDFQQLSYTEYANAINHTTAAQRAEWQKASIAEWLYESNQLAEKLYTDVKQGDNLSYAYNFSHIDILNQQMLKAGVRLAGVLNAIFG
jgi:hypothetical protein